MISSQGGHLNLVMVARASTLISLDPRATGWVYDVCPSAGPNVAGCGTGGLPYPYAGVRLQLTPGDSLTFRLYNRLPPVLDSDHDGDEGMDYLHLNPVNVHTHGLLVSPHFPTPQDQTYGDNVFVMTLNPANGPVPPDAKPHGDVRLGFTDYRIDIPSGHPSGLFWFHPHVHGISQNQIEAGMAGVITVGQLSDYVCADPTCVQSLASLRQRHMILRDTQILANGQVMDELDPDFCDPTKPLGNGVCPGVDDTDEGGGNYTGGKWYFSINGQYYPNVTLGNQGEVWRITNASPSASYVLDLWSPAEKRSLAVQILAIDGVAVNLNGITSPAAIAALGGGKFVQAQCPPPSNTVQAPLCASKFLMMPSSRVELYVAYRDAQGRIAAPPTPTPLILRTDGRQTGPTGDYWPPVNLATVDMSHFAPTRATAQVLTTRTIPGQVQMTRIAAQMAAANRSVGVDPTCAALAPGHMRRIFFNVPTGDPDGFGLGYEEVDQNGNPVPGTFQDVHRFDPDTPTICVPLAPGNQPVHERWQIINLAGEDHNFHLHQVKFTLLSYDVASGLYVTADAIKHDNVPLPHADGTCNSVADWRNHLCSTHNQVVDIPFTIAGDFVYHCHILEHEDGGMMARIRVRPSS